MSKNMSTDETLSNQIITQKRDMFETELHVFKSRFDLMFTWMLLSDNVNKKDYDSAVKLNKDYNDSFFKLYKFIKKLNYNSEDLEKNLGKFEVYYENYQEKRQEVIEFMNERQQNFKKEWFAKKDWKSEKIKVTKDTDFVEMSVEEFTKHWLDPQKK